MKDRLNELIQSLEDLEPGFQKLLSEVQIRNQRAVLEGAVSFKKTISLLKTLAEKEIR